MYLGADLSANEYRSKLAGITYTRLPKDSTILLSTVRKHSFLWVISYQKLECLITGLSLQMLYCMLITFLRELYRPNATNGVTSLIPGLRSNRKKKNEKGRVL